EGARILPRRDDQPRNRCRLGSQAKWSEQRTEVLDMVGITTWRPHGMGEEVLIRPASDTNPHRRSRRPEEPRRARVHPWLERQAIDDRVVALLGKEPARRGDAGL